MSAGKASVPTIFVEPRDTDIVSMLEAKEEVRDQVNAHFHDSEEVVIDLTGIPDDEARPTIKTEDLPQEVPAPTIDVPFVFPELVKKCLQLLELCLKSLRSLAKSENSRRVK